MLKKIKQFLKKPVANISMILLLAAAVMFFTLRKDGQAIMSTLKNVNVPVLLGIFGLMVFERFLLGWGLSKECQLNYPKYTTKQGFVNAYVAGLFNNITPGASGGQIAQGYIFRKQGIPVTNSVGILWLDFIVYQTTMCSFVLFLLLIRFGYFYSNYSSLFGLVILGFLVGASIIVLLYALVSSPKFYMWLTTTGINIGEKLHIVKNKEQTIAKLNAQLTQFSREIIVLKNHKMMIFYLALEDLLRLVIYYSIPFLCAVALRLEVNWPMYVNTVALSAFVAMINAFLPMPGSAGGTEATFILMFSTIFTSIDAKSIMILWRVLTFYQVLIVGSVMFLYARTRKDVPIEEAKPVTFRDGVIEEEEKGEL